MGSSQTLLELLRTRTIVDCDTMDVEFVKNFGPTQQKFVDCTSNQAIAFGELQKPNEAKLVQEVVEFTKTLASKFPEIKAPELAGEIAMVKLQLEISKYITGNVHIQTNPFNAYSVEKTVQNAKRIIQHFQNLDPSFDKTRICIKIPGSWEGFKACEILQSEGIKTLGTTLFNIEQAALAGEVRCHYIAPYVNELRVHFDPTFKDENKAQKLCLLAQKYYAEHNFKTQVLPASLTSTDEIMELAGVHHITIAPGLLDQLALLPAESNTVVSLFDDISRDGEGIVGEKLEFKSDEAAWRLAFTRSGRGEGERKLSQAINIFCDMQEKLEAQMAALL